MTAVGLRAPWITALVLWVGACATTTDTAVMSADEQYATAVSLFEEEKWQEAISAMQAFTLNYPQDPRVTEARWLAAEAYYSAEDWATAAQEYLNFQRDFPTSQRAAAGLYQAARSYQRLSLRPELDQRDTERAINVLERLLTEYPQSDLVGETRERRASLRNKLAEKAYLNAEFYFDNKYYDAAEIYLVDLIEQHPDSDWLPAGYALLAQTFCRQGLQERAVEVFELLRQTFPDSEAALRLEGVLPEECRRVISGVRGSDEENRE